MTSVTLIKDGEVVEREEALEMAIMMYVMANDVGDEDIPSMIACGCEKCVAMATMYALVREKVQPFMVNSAGSNSIN